MLVQIPVLRYKPWSVGNYFFKFYQCFQRYRYYSAPAIKKSKSPDSYRTGMWSMISKLFNSKFFTRFGTMLLQRPKSIFKNLELDPERFWGLPVRRKPTTKDLRGWGDWPLPGRSRCVSVQCASRRSSGAGSGACAVSQQCRTPYSQKFRIQI